jgi:hypothetical protein
MSNVTTTLTACPDPNCGQVLNCAAECVCPMCWLPYDGRNYQAHSMAAWFLYAPVMRALNEEGIEWLWGTNRNHAAPPVHDIEIEYDAKHSITITRRGAHYTADLHAEIARATRIDTAAWDCVDGFRTESLSELIAWVADTMRATTEEVS